MRTLRISWSLRILWKFRILKVLRILILLLKNIENSGQYREFLRKMWSIRIWIVNNKNIVINGNIEFIENIAINTNKKPVGYIKDTRE